MTWGPFEEHRIYNRRRDIHSVFSGQNQGGICTPRNHPVVICFTSASGEAHGYSDGWDAKSGLFLYFGAGQVGDMKFIWGNRAIRDHAQDGKDVLLFQAKGREGVLFLGQFECAGYSNQWAPDTLGNQRQAIVFSLAPMAAVMQPVQLIAEVSGQATDLETLRQRALEATSTPSIAGAEALRILYRRSEDVRRYVLARAKGICEACGEPAPFVTKAGEPYLEPHHTRRLSDGGPDDPRFVGAVCPACHREIHYGREGEAKNAALVGVIRSKERL